MQTRPSKPAHATKKMTRREWLMGAGAILSGSLVCGVAGTTLFSRLLNSADDPQIVVVTSPPTQIPMPTQPIITQPSIITRRSWGALAPNHNARNEFGFYSDNNPLGWRVYDDDLVNIYKTVVIHHSVVYETDDLTSVKVVQDLHQNDRRWADVGYHYVIGRDGGIYEGRDVHVRGAHTGGFNTGSLGICLLGNFEINTVTESQLNSLEQLLRWVTYRFQPSHIAGHRDFDSNTVCPGKNLFQYLPDFAQLTGLTHGTEGYVAPTT